MQRPELTIVEVSSAEKSSTRAAPPIGIDGVKTIGNLMLAVISAHDALNAGLRHLGWPADTGDDLRRALGELFDRIDAGLGAASRRVT